jgi:sec-independent protein translocase protein TatC
LAEECRLVTLGPTGNMVVYFRVSLLIGAIVSIPIVTYQLLMFIFPGLTRKERRMILLSIPAVTVLFLVGVLFSWFVLMRPALGFLEGFQTDIFRPEWTADLYLSFVTSLVFWMGVAFQTPLILFVLSLIGIVDAPGLRRAWRVAIVGAAAASAFITPTVDPVNMMLVMAPLVGLYIISIFLVMIGQRIAGLQAAAAEANPG